MIADFSTNPLQGAKFIEFWDKTLGIREADFEQCKGYIKILNQYDLYDNEEDLFDIWLTNIHIFFNKLQECVGI